GKENPKRCENAAASRDRGTEGYNNPAQQGGLDCNKKIRLQERCFLLDSFYRTNQVFDSAQMTRERGRTKFLCPNRAVPSTFSEAFQMWLA
ncbi:MAG: hypothetical protein WAL32_14940, partial [Terriglobales bacterium]